jgi:hypothetical protein
MEALAPVVKQLGHEAEQLLLLIAEVLMYELYLHSHINLPGVTLTFALPLNHLAIVFVNPLLFASCTDTVKLLEA